MRQALLLSLICHAALGIGSFLWIAFGGTNDVPQVFTVDLVQAVPAASAPATASVEVARPTPAPVETRKEAEQRNLRPEPSAEKPRHEETAPDLTVASTEIRVADEKTELGSVDDRVVQPRLDSGVKDSRFAIDTPAGEPGLVGIEASGSPVPLRMSQPDSRSRTYVILHAVQPEYPPRERERGIEGNVTVELVVDELGSVAKVNVVELVGPESFRTSAIAAVRQFKFQPPIENGVPSSMWIKFRIKFRINDGVDVR